MNAASTDAEPHDHRGGDPGSDAADRKPVGEELGDDQRCEGRDQRDAAENADPGFDAAR